MIPGSNQLHSLATKYSKPQLQQMAQMGEISPLDAVMAGMMIDRIVLSANKPPESTVADDVFAPKTQLAGVAPGNGGQEAPGLAQAPQSAADISRAHGGLMSIPRPGEKYNQDNFATGGIVAFQQGGAPWESLEKAPPRSKNYPPLSRALQGLTESPDMRIDPATGEAVSLGEYMRRQEPKPQIMSSPEAAAAPAVAAPLAVVKAREKIGETKPAPAGPLAAMAQKAEPASDEFAQKGMDALKLPKRTPADTTGLVDTPESIAKNKKDLLYRTVGYTGAEMMAGKSPFALVNIGEALSKGFSAYAQQIGEHKKATKDDIKDLAAIKRGEQALEQGEYKISADILQNELTNKRALEVAEKQIKKDLDVARIGAESRIRDKNITPFEVYANPNSTPEQKAAALEFVGAGKRDFSREQGLKLEELWVEERTLPKYRNLSDAQLAVAKQNWIATLPGFEKTGGGGGGYQPTESQLKALNKNQG
jgi:hypothetical protein